MCLAAGVGTASAPALAATSGDPSSANPAPLAPSSRTGDPLLDRVADQLDEIPDSANSSAPVLWSTRVQDGRGQAVRGAWVVAYVMQNEMAESESDRQLVPIAKAMSGVDGSATVRLDPTAVAQYLRDGYVNVWYAIGAGGDVTLAGDTVSTAGGRGSAWRTSLTEELVARGQLNAGSGLDSRGRPPTVPGQDVAQTIAEEIERDQPQVVTIDAGPSVQGLSSTPTLPTLCSVYKNYSDYNGRVTVGTMYMADKWSSSLTWIDQTTSQTQWNASGSLSIPLESTGTASMDLGVGGTFAVTERSTGGQINAARAAAGGSASYKIRPYYLWGRQQWKCSNGYPNAQYYYKFVTWPKKLRNDLWTESSLDVSKTSSSIPTCSNNTRKVSSTYNYNRTAGSSVTDYGTEYSFGITIAQVGIGIAGQSSTTFTNSQTQYWINGSTSARWICSSTGSLSGTPTIVATSRT